MSQKFKASVPGAVNDFTGKRFPALLGSLVPASFQLQVNCKLQPR